MNNFGRIVACGMISQYNKPPEEAYGVTNLMQVVGKRLKMQGFIVRLDRLRQTCNPLADSAVQEKVLTYATGLRREHGTQVYPKAPG